MITVSRLLLGAGSRSAGGKLFCAFVASLEMRR
jgi:hypothetical protein